MIKFLTSIVGKLWLTIIGLVIIVLAILGMFMLEYIDHNFSNSHAVKSLFFITGVIGFSMTTLFALFLSSRITRPLIQLKEAAEHITQGNYNKRISYMSRDELGDLAKVFNNMAEQTQELIDALKHEKEHLSSILSSMSDAVVSFDAEGHVILANPQGQKLVDEWNGIEWDEGLLEADRDDSVTRAGDRSHVMMQVIPRVLEESDRSVPKPLLALYESVVSGSAERMSKLNVLSTVWSVVITPMYSDRELRGAVAVLRDVTEENKLDKLRNDFVANISHELRTPLSMVQGYSEALLDDIAASPEEQRQHVQVIHEESLRMGRLVKDLLDLAKMQSGHLEMFFTDVDIGELLRRVDRKFQSIARERGITLECSLSEPNLMVRHGDEDRLEQVLTNLMDNAIRHTQESKHIRLVAKHVSMHEANWIQIDVADEGQGIPEADLPYIFERFYKADKARTRGYGGTGLGLAIVKNIVDAHHGTVSVTSKLGQGTTFTILLPIE